MPARSATAARGEIQHALREGMSRLPCGVAVVTSWIQGRPWGTTVSSCSSLSMDPPLVLLALAATSVSARVILEQQSFGVNVLSADGVHVAMRGAAVGQPKFFDDIVRNDIAEGSPVLRDTLAAIHCELYNAVLLGDHVVVIGEVTSVDLHGEADALVYHRRAFHRLTHESAT